MRWSLFLLLFIVGCSPQVNIDKIPEWPGKPEIVGREALIEAMKGFDGAWVRTDDGAFMVVPHEHAKTIADWWFKYNFQMGLKATPHSWACDKYAKGLVLAFNQSAAKSGIPASPMVAVIPVIQAERWGGISAGQYHAVVGIVTDQGLYIIEPQTKFMDRKEKYPNPIMEIRVGG